MSILKRAKNILGDSNSRDLKRLRPLVAEVGAWEDEFSALSDDQLRAKTVEFRERLEDGAALDDPSPRPSQSSGRPASAGWTCAITTCS